MTKTAITHKLWCREHQTDYEGEHCFSGGFEFGPMKPAQGDFPAHRTDDIWAGQQLGVDAEPTGHRWVIRSCRCAEHTAATSVTS